MDEKILALNGIRKKLVGKTLNYKEIYAIMDEISHARLGDILTTYFAASGYASGFSDEEIYFLTKAMVATGETLHFPGIVADKHSIGGIPGTRTTMIVIPIVASAGFIIPKSSSRAITTPGGTADDMEVLCPVVFSKKEIYEIVEQTKACIVWGGSVSIAPADDELIKVETPLMFESFDKVLVSIMAKKIAFGSNHIVIDLPYGKTAKVHNLKDAEILALKFENLAKRFNVKVKVLTHKTEEPAGRGVGPVLETREALRVLEQHKNRPLDLEEKALNLAGALLDLCLEDSTHDLRTQIKQEFGSGRKWAEEILKSGKAHLKMLEIIKAQGGHDHITSESLKEAKYQYQVPAKQSGKIKEVDIRNLTAIAKILGAPLHKKAGIYLDRKIGEEVRKGETIYTLHSENEYNLKESLISLANFPLISYE